MKNKFTAIDVCGNNRAAITTAIIAMAVMFLVAASALSLEDNTHTTLPLPKSFDQKEIGWLELFDETLAALIDGSHISMKTMRFVSQQADGTRFPENPVSAAGLYFGLLSRADRSMKAGVPSGKVAADIRIIIGNPDSATVDDASLIKDKILKDKDVVESEKTKIDKKDKKIKDKEDKDK